MSITDLLRRAAEAGVFLSYENAALRFRLTTDVFPPALKEEILTHRDALTAFLKASAKQGQREGIRRYARTTARFPASSAQRRLWFVDELLGGSPHYNMPIALRVAGHFDVTCAQQALQKLIARHEPLRTVFVPGDAGPLQQIEESFDFRLVYEDLSPYAAPEQEARIARAIAQDTERPFDLARDLMLRAMFLRQSAQSGVLLLNMHHIAADGWSLGIVAREFAALYQAELRKHADALPPLPIQYLDYAMWQRALLESDAFRRQMQYWEECLRDAPELHSLPTDRARPQRQRFNGARLTTTVDSTLLAGLKALARARGATLFMVLHAALSIVLARVSGSRDIVIGMPVANRQQREVEGLVGCFLNMLALRSRIEGDPAFEDYLDQIKLLHLQAQTNQDVPFEYLVERLNPRRALSHAPLVQIVLTLDVVSLRPLPIEGATLTPIPDDRVTAKFDLLVTVNERADGMSIELEYDTDLFERETVARLARWFVALLESAQHAPGERIYALPMLSAAESDYLIHGLNATSVSYEQAGCLHELFERQVAKTPDAVAVVFEQQALSYRELNAWSNRLAHYLRERGVKPDMCVALCAQRSLAMVVGILGILKAGGAYVPLDPDYPPDRLAYMINDCAPALVLIGAGIDLPIQTTHVRFDLTSAPFADYPADNLPAQRVGVRPEHLAYVMYTSGSTGQPKGVMNQHDAVVNGLLWALETFPLSSADGVLQKTPFSFDVSVWEFMMALLSGARLVMARPGGHRDPQYLAELVEREGITLIHFVPSMLQVFLEHEVSNRCRKLRWILCSGEALPHALQQRSQAIFPNAELHNLYGPTEAAVHATAWRCRSDLHPGIVPIGRPLANTQTYILDGGLQPVPLGAVGELYLGGVGVARGYLNRPELTEERFIADPFRRAPGARLYRTGDLCRCLADGTLEYLGRNDFQVKVRGFRIELGEIEQQLNILPGVKSAIVVARDDEAGQKQLVAYLVIDEERRDDEGSLVESLRGRLREHLPDYMVPSAFVLLDALPLTPSGKVDRKTLPAPSQADTRQEYVAPAAGTEAELAGLWAALLSREPGTISTLDHFFELGGHSLLAVRLVAQIRAHFAAAISLHEVFSSARLCEMARLIDARRSTADRQFIVARTDRPELIPASFAQRRIWFIEQMVPDSAQYNIPGGMWIAGDFNPEIAEQALRLLIERHEALRTVFVNVDGEPRQKVRHTFEFALQIQDLSGVAVEDRGRAVLALLDEQARKPFDLSRDLMLRAIFVRLGEKDGALLFNMHHIAADGWSLNILMRELLQLYHAMQRGETDPLPPLSIQYADYAMWQHEALRGHLGEQIAYWKRQLADLPSVHSLPLDRPRPARQTFDGAAQSVTLERSTAEALRQLAISNEATLFMVLHAAFTLLLSRHSNSPDIVVGTPVANRTQGQLDSLVGCFVNMLALRTQCPASGSFEEYLAHVKAVNLDAQVNQDVPFEHLVDVLQPARTAAHSPIFQITLAMNAVNAPPQLPSLKLTPVQFVPTTVKYDLCLDVTELDSGLELSFTHNRDLFEATTISNLGERLCTLLRSVVTHPQSRVCDLQLLPESERRHLLRTLNVTYAVYPRSRCLHELFEEQVRRTPSAVALVCEDRQLTYSELNEHANRLAHQLRRWGVKPEKLVGVCVQRSPEMVIAMLAILKAGGAYVPLDPSYPPQRLAYMVKDSGMEVMLTQTNSAAVLSGLEGVRRIELDEQSTLAALREEPARDLERTAGQSASNLAYVIYTSGSTGQPKGVMIEHRAAVNLICGMKSRLPSAGGRPWLLLTSISFDIALYEWMGALTSGDCCVIASETQYQDVYRLRQLLDREEIGLIQATPSRWQQLLDAGWRAKHRPIGLCGGEALTGELERGLREAGVWLWNCYGPTEATVWSLLHEVREGDSSRTRVSLGRGLPNYRHLVLDEQQRLVPFGAVGELYIGGESVARGYWGRAELTEQRFISDPYEQKGRLYRSGDRVRYLADGNLEFLGRIDHQVKIRGHRIELGEIEQQLCSLAAVRSAVVVVRDTPSHQKRLVAYVSLRKHDGTAVAAHDAVAQLRSALQDTLPPHMVPERFVILEDLPLTPNGKVDRNALPPEQTEPDPTPLQYAVPVLETEQRLCAIWQDVLQLPRVGIKENFFELGGNSLLTVRVRDAIAKQFGRELALADLFEYPTISALARYLSPEESRRIEAEKAHPVQSPATRSRDIAVIGMAGRFPDAADVSQYWANISAGLESLRIFSDTELLAAGCDPRLLQEPNYVKRGAVLLDGIEELDAAFFNVTPREAELMDPQHRLLLECATEALENAGYGNTGTPQNVGVFVGATDSVYLLTHILPNLSLSDPALMSVRLANSRDFAATRLSYKLNLTGPSITVATACSTSLVAVHQACNSLLLGECSMALAGGANVASLKPHGYLFVEGDIRSADGRCRAFDKDAQGTRDGDGAGLVLLKRLEDALQDGDTIHAVIKGSAINNDAADKVGYTAPAVSGQVAGIRAAHRNAGVDPKTLQYVEAHGTGTKLGDPIEIRALTAAFAAEKHQYCALGSVKPNIGHLDAASGIAGLIKVVAALKARQLPPAINFHEPNPAIDFAHSPFYVNTTLREWPRQDTPRRAAVSSFGIGGTNAHVVVEEAPDPNAFEIVTAPQLLTLSAKGEIPLAKRRRDLLALLEQGDRPDLADVAYTLQVGRASHEVRDMVVCRDVNDAMRQLREHDSANVASTLAQPISPPAIVFVFPGQGAQYAGMARGLYDREPSVRADIDECARLFAPLLGVDLREVLFADEDHKAGDPSRLDQTAFAQPALFTVEYALANLLRSWGITPTAMIGHSLGEYVAACLAGVFSLPDAIALIATRGRLMQSIGHGQMLSVAMPSEWVQTVLEGSGCEIAAINAPGNCVLSGAEQAIERLRETFETQGVATRKLHTSHAFHSSMVDPILDDFGEALRRTTRALPRIPYLSSLTGDYVRDADATAIEYWQQQLRRPVQFSLGIATLLAEAGQRKQRVALLEVGPGSSLSTFARSCSRGTDALVLPTMRHPRSNDDDAVMLLTAVGNLWLAGAHVDWQRMHSKPRRRVPLPTYPFQRQRYWIDPENRANGALRSGTRSGDVRGQFYVPTWKLKALPAALTSATTQNVARPESRWMVFCDDVGLADRVITELRTQGTDVVCIRAGDDFVKIDRFTYVLQPGNAAHYELLFESLRQEEYVPQRVVHMFSLSASPLTASAERDFDAQQDYGACSLLYLVQALSKSVTVDTVQVDVFTAGAFRVTGDESLDPAAATVCGIIKVAPQEYGELSCYHVDLAAQAGRSVDDGELQRLAESLIAELRARERSREVAYRGSGQRWVRFYDSSIAAEQTTPSPRLRDGGVYLITGGLGRIGLALAEGLTASVAGVKLILVGRSKVDLTVPGIDETRRSLLQSLEARGAQILVMQADVADLAQMESVFRTAEERFGAVHGVIHCAGHLHGAAKPVQVLRREDYEEQYRTKVNGTLVLNEILRERPVDFCLLMSSLSAVLGGLGFAAYAAANSFMDAFAQSRHAANDQRWLSVNWDAWLFEAATAPDGYRETFGVTAAQGVRALEELLKLEAIPQVVQCTGGLTERLARWVELRSTPPERRAVYVRPRSRSELLRPRNDIERRLLENWQELLGIADIGVDESFFDLGGDSLLATRAANFVKTTFALNSGQFSIVDFFSKPIIADVARSVGAHLTSTHALEQKHKLLQEGKSVEEGAL